MTHSERKKFSAEREEARESYRASVAAGEPLSGAKLGAEFGRSERWGRDRIKEVKTEEDRRTQFALASRNPGLSATALLMERGEIDANGNLKGVATNDTAASGASGRTEAASDLAAVKPEPAAEVDDRQVPAQPRGAAAVAWLALVLGIGASVAANVLHTWTVLADGSGSLPQVLGSAFWPVALVVSIETMARVRWPASIGYSLIRFGAVGAVALVAAVVSYRHMSGLLAYWGEDPISATLGPIAVDGLVTVGALALLAIHKARKEA
ncbi:DUF2637 domain-containing protein [Glycomyces buryatensis]|uniref:DUF2637 domain-containing protein n=1 Tax=Glycomyces buryatensis TaxID=2570927 RepID=A0A4S8QS52_9ACTN|nr:DUF2637 domain-containing protein [Glycomyces buryatensis]THV43464.1 hypothetical protein FAB82_00975 [Glycomyces buryatensis]